MNSRSFHATFIGLLISAQLALHFATRSPETVFQKGMLIVAVLCILGVLYLGFRLLLRMINSAPVKMGENDPDTGRPPLGQAVQRSGLFLILGVGYLIWRQALGAPSERVKTVAVVIGSVVAAALFAYALTQRGKTTDPPYTTPGSQPSVINAEGRGPDAES